VFNGSGPDLAYGFLITCECSRTGNFCRETARRLSAMGSFRMPRVKVKAAAAVAAAISLGKRAAGRRCCGWACVQRQQLWCLKRQGTSLRAVGCVSCHGTATVRLEAGQLNSVLVSPQQTVTFINNKSTKIFVKFHSVLKEWWLGSRVASVLDSGSEGPGSNRSRDAVG